MTAGSHPRAATGVRSVAGAAPSCSLLAAIALLLLAGACSDGKDVTTSPTAAASSGAPTTTITPTTSTVAPTSAAPTSTASPITDPLSSEPVLGLPGESPTADLDSPVEVPSFPSLVRYEGTLDVRGEQVVTLTIGRVVQGEPFFSPTILEGSSNQRVTLRVSNTTPTAHNFTLEAEQINEIIPIDETVDITVQFPSSGALVFYCAFHARELHGGGLYTIA